MELADYLAQRSASPAPNTEASSQESAGGDAAAETNLNRLTELLRESDSDAANFFSHIKASLCNIIPDSALQQLGAWINDYEFDTALAWVTDYRNGPPDSK